MFNTYSYLQQYLYLLTVKYFGELGKKTKNRTEEIWLSLVSRTHLHVKNKFRDASISNSSPKSPVYH